MARVEGNRILVGQRGASCIWEVADQQRSNQTRNDRTNRSIPRKYKVQADSRLDYSLPSTPIESCGSRPTDGVSVLGASRE